MLCGYIIFLYTKLIRSTPEALWPGCQQDFEGYAAFPRRYIEGLFWSV